MKTDSILVFISLFAGVLLIAVSKPKAPMEAYVDKAIGLVNKQFQQDLTQFYESTTDFQNQVALFEKNQIDQNTLLAGYAKLRNCFKHVSFFLEYLDKEAYDKLLNGPPLLKLEKKVADLTILQPKGIQVIDELIGGGKLEAENTKSELLQHAIQLQNDQKKIKEFLQVRYLTDRQFFEATRQGIVRLMTLGITGFDTPGTQSGVSDASAVLQSMRGYLEMYRNEMERVHHEKLANQILAILDHGINRSEIASFDNLNRLAFIKEVLDPLYAKILEMHLALDYETIEEVSRYPSAVNYQAKSLFDKDFLNKFYYVSIANDTNFDKVASLGKLLFYDPVLSYNNAVSCASCHNPTKAFTDGLPTSLSNKQQPLKRNSMTLNYSGYATGFFHDLRSKRLEDQFEHVILNKDEFNSSYQAILEKLEGSDAYKSLFDEAFPNQKKPVKSNNVDYALAAYVMNLASFDSPIDQYFQGKNTTISPSIERGFNLFAGKANCATCHFLPLYSGLVPPLYVESEAEILGVPDRPELPWILDDDLGRVGNGLSQEVAPFYNAAFKTPTLRNINRTAPYMHNGVFKTLEEVMDFYNKGGGVGQGLELEHQTLAPEPLNLNKQEVADIISFMEAINDQTIFKAVQELPKDFNSTQINNRQVNK